VGCRVGYVWLEGDGYVVGGVGGGDGGGGSWGCGEP